MDRTSNQREIPNTIAEAYEFLLQHRIIEITEPIQQNLQNGRTDWIFKCMVQMPFPNKENLPSEVHLKVSIPETFPYSQVDIYPICEEVRGFPHQDASGLRKLCLHEERLAPVNTSRLVCYVKWAIEWLKDAANGTLLKPGDSYELPDFRNESMDSSIPTKFPLIFDESSNSYKCWETYIGEFGNVDCYWGSEIQTIFAVRFYDKSGSPIRESEFTPNVLRKNGKIEGRWILIPDIRYERHRPPQTFEEIERLCLKNGVDFYQNLKAAWNRRNPDKVGILLIGFPIPKIFEETSTEIHWQPLFIRNYGSVKNLPKKRNPKAKSSKQNQVWQKLIKSGCFSLSQQLPWGKVQNIARERLYARGVFPSEMQSTHMAFFGCGALGSSVAELLARGGIKQLNLFDFDSIQFGNLCRHTLDGSSVGLNKAEELAVMLSRANPISRIKGHAVGIPLNSGTDETIHQVLAKADVFINCTTSDAAFDWLNEYAVENDKRLISMFFNLRAELLTICISGESASCRKIFDDLKNSVKNNQTSVDPAVYFHEPSKDEEIIEGPGCWHPTFPAQYAHVQILAAHAVDIINYSLSTKSKSGIAAIVERQSVLQNGIQSGPLVKVAWTKEY